MYQSSYRYLASSEVSSNSDVSVGNIEWLDFYVKNVRFLDTDHCPLVTLQPVLAYPSNVSSYSRSLSSYPSQTSVSSGHLHDPHKLDAVKQAADNIIREKDNIIDR